MAGVVGNRGETANEEDIEKDGKDGEDGDAAEEDGEEDAEDEIQDGSARHALNSLLPGWNVHVLVGEDREEVAVDAEDDGCAAKLQEAQASLAEAQDDTAEGHGDKVLGGEVEGARVERGSLDPILEM